MEHYTRTHPSLLRRPPMRVLRRRLLGPRVRRLGAGERQDAVAEIQGARTRGGARLEGRLGVPDDVVRAEERLEGRRIQQILGERQFR